ncbi:MAG: hypothetical protein AAF726_05850 [Planctomycetota bacterium]
MKHSIQTSLAQLAVGAALAAPGLAQVDDFDDGTNPNGWSFGVTTPDVVESTGGNPGGWLRNPLVDSFAPIVTSGAGATAPYIGDLRANGVARILVDARTDAVSITAAARNLTLVLRDTKGTPTVDDDDYAYSVGALIPQVGQGWVPYSFDVPSASTDAVPAGWAGGWVGDVAAFRPGVDWNDVITSVDRVEFWWIDPTFFAIFQQWDVGIDNVAAEFGGLGTNECGPAVPNSTGESGVIAASGSANVVDNDVTLRASSLTPNAFGFFLTSQVRAVVMNPGGSAGRLCLGGSIGRYVGPGEIKNSGPAGEFELALDLSLTPTPTGPVAIQPGQTWYFQAWHRENGGGQATSNFTDALAIAFQ